MQHSWHSRVVDRLRERRRDGYTFDVAWSMAMKELPPPNRTRGAAIPVLFDETNRAPDTQLAFFRRACENAWHDVVGPPVGEDFATGQGPTLRHFSADMIRIVDASSSAPRSRAGGRIRQAA